MKTTTLNQAELAAILKQIHANATQEQRLLTYLADNPKSPTVNVNAACSIGNISHVAGKLNKILFKHDLFIACERPPTPIKNKFGENSQMFEWSLYRLENNGEAMNDSENSQKSQAVKP